MGQFKQDQKIICLSPLTTKHISSEIRSHGGDPFVTTWHITSEHIQSSLNGLLCPGTKDAIENGWMD